MCRAALFRHPGDAPDIAIAAFRASPWDRSLDTITDKIRSWAHHRARRDDEPAWRRWVAVIVQSAHDLWKGNVLEWSASLAFFAVLSVFPLLLMGLILLSWLLDPGLVTDRTVELLGEFLPGGEENIRQIVKSAVADRRQVGAISAITFLITGRRVLGALVKGLNHVSDVNQQEETPRRAIAVEIAMVAGLVVMILLALGSGELVSRLWQVVTFLPGPDHVAFQVMQVVIRAVFLLLFFAVTFTVVPLGDRVWRAAVAGAVASTALFLLAQGIFAVLLEGLWSNLSLAYGPLAVAALLMTWAWCVAIITLAGGGLASHIKVMIVENATPQEAEERHVTP